MLPMTHRPKSHVIGDKAQTRVRQCLEDAGFVVNDLPRDYGEDLLVRIFCGETATPYAFLVQSKGGGQDRKRRLASSRNREHGYRIPVSKGHLALWRRLALPVLVTYWDEITDQIYWTFVPAKRYSWPQSDSANNNINSVWIPCSNVLDQRGINIVRVEVIERHFLTERMAQCIEILIDLLSTRSSLYDIQCDPLNMALRFNDRNDDTERLITAIFFGSHAKLWELQARAEGYAA